jgi:hypothetical protein
MFEPKATAPHLDSTNRVILTVRRSLPVFTRKPDILGISRCVSNVPEVTKPQAGRTLWTT